MENTMKHLAPKLTLAASAFGISLLLAPSALAADASNSNTGAGSDNDAEVNISNNVTINQSNNANINNNIYVNANTGGNSASKNTGDGSVNTGDINGSISITNDVNGNSLNNVGVDCDGLCVVVTGLSASNENTGADSDNDAKVDVDNDYDFTQDNDLDIDNDVDADLNTGDNEADKNTGDGSVTTGDINFEINIDNQGNNNVIGGPTDEPEEPNQEPKGPAIIQPSPRPGKDEGKVLAATSGLPVTGGNLPFIPALILVLAGLGIKRAEEILRLRLLPESK